MGERVALTIDAGQMDCYVARPATNVFGGILVCMHGPGVDEFIRDICERLANLGYLAIAPDFYHRQGSDLTEPWSKVVDTEAIVDMRVATDFLEAYAVTPIGILGFCMGGRLAFLNLAHDDRLKTGIIIHGGNIMKSRDAGLPSPLDQTDAIHASVLGIFGEDDVNPSPADRVIIEQRLQSAGVEFRLDSYQGAGHAFLNFTRPEVYREKQAELAWDSCVTWLQSEMRTNA